MLFEPLVAHDVIGAIATNAPAFYGLLDIIEFKSYKRGLVERNLLHI
jgi:hypothetical protein